MAVYLNQDNQTYLEPEKRTILVYDFEHDEINIYGFQDKVSVRILNDLEINFAEFQFLM